MWLVLLQYPRHVRISNYVRYRWESKKFLSATSLSNLIFELQKITAKSCVVCGGDSLCMLKISEKHRPESLHSKNIDCEVYLFKTRCQNNEKQNQLPEKTYSQSSIAPYVLANFSVPFSTHSNTYKALQKNIASRKYIRLRFQFYRG